MDSVSAPADVLVLGVDATHPLVTWLAARYACEPWVVPLPLATADELKEFGDVRFHVIVDANAGDDAFVQLSHALMYCAGRWAPLYDCGVYCILNATARLQGQLQEFAAAACLQATTDEPQLAMWSNTGVTVTLARSSCTNM